MKSFLSSRVRQLNVGVLGYTDNSDVVDVIGNIKSSGTLISTIENGTSPLSVQSTTLVTNLNADLLDGQQGTYYLNIENATGNFSIGDIFYASSQSSISKLPIGGGGSLLSVVNGIPSWQSTTAEDLGGISGIEIYDDDANPVYVGKIDKLSFDFGLLANLDPLDNTKALITLDLSVITTEAIGAISGIRILDENTFLGEVQNINFVGANITASVNGGTATITLNDNPTFGTVSINAQEGTSPLSVQSKTLVDNLNADLLDGQQGSYYRNASNLNAGTVPTARLSGSYNINISGTATTATNANYINVVKDNSDTNYKIPFTNSNGGFQTIYIDDNLIDFTYNPNTGVLSSKQFSSSVADGVSPLTVTSTTLVANLNVDKLDDQHGSYYLNLANATGILATTKGGTGLSSYATGDILYSSGTNILSKLTIGSTNQVLTVNAGVPTWKSLTSGDVGAINGVDIEEDGSNIGTVTTLNFNTNLDASVNGSTATIDLSDDPSVNTITLGVSTGTAPLVVTSTTLVSNLNADLLDDQHGSYYLDLANATGTLAATKGGTGISTYTTGDILYASGTNILAKLPIGGSSNVLTIENGVPVWKSLTSGDVGAISGVDIQENGSNIGSATTINFNTNLDASVNGSTATIDLSDDPSVNTISITVADGTAPLTITSTTLVSNLNADLLDDQHGSYYLDLANATGTLAATKGGTGISTYTTGDILYSSAANTLSKLTIGSQNQILSVSASGIPEWINPTVAGINILEEGTLVGSATSINFVGRAITATFDTPSSTATITLSDTPTFSTITSDVVTGTAPLVVTSTTLVANLNVDKLDDQHGSYYLNLNNATGTLAATKGGTGLSSYATGDILYSSAANTLSKLTIGSQNQILSVSASGIPEWINPTVAGINILEEGTLVGSATSINFVGRAITATFATSTATITLSDTPTFSTITSDVATGTAPLVVTSTTLVSNLNADKLDDKDGSHYLALANATGSLGETKGGTGQTTYATGDILYSSATDTLSKLTIGSQNQILSVSASGIPEWKTASGGASATVSATPPPNPIAGDLWYDSDSAALYVYYNDGNTSQWVSTSVGGGGTTDPQNLSELLDVDFGGTTPADKTVLTYSSTLGAWQPQAPAQYYASFRPSTSTQSVATSGVTIDFDEIVVRSDNWPLATVNNSGYIYVPVTGKYLVTVSIYVDTTNTSTRNAMETWLYSNANGYVSRAMSHAYNPLNTYYYASTHMSAIISVTSTASYVCYAGASFNATAGYTTGNVTQDSRLNIVYLGE